MTQPGADPLVGRTVAHYEIVSRLGGGGMGVVYQAIDRKLGRAVALKFLPQQWSHDEGAKQRFLREAQAASATAHPNICTIHDIATADDGQLFIVMAHYAGDTLKHRLEAGPLPVDEALDIATQVADGLARAHAQGVVHRDIKPGNLILTEDGVRIVDFGLATFVDALQLTTEGSTLGTAAYMSPEQVRGQEVDARSDVWAAGVVLYQMLSGHTPFRGAYAEAIGHAIRTEPPPPLRAARPGIPEEVEQLVFRALHKDAAIRFQSGRELARALRQVRGLTVPQDLRTMAVDVKGTRGAGQSAAPGRSRRTLYAALFAASVLLTGTLLVLFLPVERPLIAVAPVANETGDETLSPYRMALTHELVSQLARARAVRVLPFERLLEIVRPFRRPGGDVASRGDALQAIASYSGAGTLLIPSLVKENGAVKARVVIQDAAGRRLAPDLEVPAVPSALVKETAYRLSVTLAEQLDDHLTRHGSRRAYLAAHVRHLFGGAPLPASPRFRVLDAAAHLEQGLAAYEQGEFAAARASFKAASAADPRDPLALAWRSRVSMLMRQGDDAVDAAERAAGLLTDQTLAADRLFVEAVVAETRRRPDARDRYRALVDAAPGEPAPLLEMAGFLNRQAPAADARDAYLAAVALDAKLPGAYLELCRLESPTRLDDPARAKQHGETALARYRNRGNLAGQAQAHWCLADVLRAGEDAERRVAAQHADEALRIMQDLSYPYGLARAYNYVAHVALSDRNGARAAEYYELTRTRARAAGNLLLESRTLMNLGVAYEMLGRRDEALKYYREGFTLIEASGAQQDAAWTQANAAAILIEHGRAPDAGLRDVENALAVFKKAGDKRFEVFARRMVARYRRHTGDLPAALSELSIAGNLAGGRDLDGSRTQVTLDQARVRFDMGDYDAAQELLVDVQRRASGTDAVHTRIELARTQTRLGRFADAGASLAAAAEEIEKFRDPGSLPLLYAAQGELAYEAGRPGDARASFAKASTFWTDDLPEAASVEARAYVGFLDALATGGRTLDAGQALVRESLAQARTMRRLALEARCRLFLARIEMSRGRADEALRILGDMTGAGPASLSPELRAQLHYWTSRAVGARGDRRSADEQLGTARRFLGEVRALLPEPFAAAVLSRPDLRLISQP